MNTFTEREFLKWMDNKKEVKKMSIEKLKQIKKVIQICDAKYVYDYKLQFMGEIINTFKDQSDEIAELKSKVKKLEKEGSYFDRVENIKEGRNLNGN